MGSGLLGSLSSIVKTGCFRCLVRRGMWKTIRRNDNNNGAVAVIWIGARLTSVPPASGRPLTGNVPARDHGVPPSETLVSVVDRRTSAIPLNADARSLTLALECSVSSLSLLFVFLGFSFKLLDRRVGYI